MIRLQLAELDQSSNYRSLPRTIQARNNKNFSSESIAPEEDRIGQQINFSKAGTVARKEQCGTISVYRIEMEVLGWIDGNSWRRWAQVDPRLPDILKRRRL